MILHVVIVRSKTLPNTLLMTQNGRQHGAPGEKSGRANILIRRLWTALETREGRRFTNRELSEYLNISDSALSDWITGKTDLNQVEAVLKLCERLQQPKSTELFNQHLRVFPTLASPELAHDPAIIDSLRSLLARPKGLTVIVGGNATQRTFLLTAVGHSYLDERGTPRSLAGWDAHAASWFVPLPGLLYLAGARCAPQALRVNGLPQCLLLSNGLWSRFSQHRVHLSRCALTQHVIVADVLDVQRLRAEIMEVETTLDVIVITGDDHRLHLTLQTFQQTG